MARKINLSTDSENQLKENERKWTKVLMDAGWTVIPNVIIQRQAALGLDAIDINILMHLASYWWRQEGKPHPSKNTIAKAMGIDPRTVQRRLSKMHADGLIRREERRIKGQGSRTNIYHLDGLIREATPYAQEKLQERQAIEEQRKAEAGRKGKPKLRVVKNEDE